jgi:PAS domain S-box-containing protein
MLHDKHWLLAGRKLLLLYGALPTAYVITGRLGLLLAISPGYATAVFLPAGIAIPAALIAGSATLPGTFLGSLLLNVWIGYAADQEFVLTKIVVAAAIAAASTLQAALGGEVLRRAVGYPAPLDNPRDLSLFLLLSPLVCLTSATTSIPAIWALGIIKSNAVAINWVTWWVGDTLGVLVGLPLMLVLSGQPQKLWRLRFWYVAVPMVICFAIFVAIFIRVKGWEETQSLAEFQVRSQQLAESIRQELEEQTLFLEELSGAFTNRSVAVDRTLFRGLVQAQLQRFPTIQGVEWAPRVTGAGRSAFEAAQRTDIPGFEIRERTAASEMRSASERSEYYPMIYIEPLAGNENAAGFDLASDSTRRSAIAASIGSRTVVATEPIRLVQEPAVQTGILLIRAISGGPTGSGVLLVVLRMGSFASALAAPLQSTLGLRLIDVGSQHILLDDLPTTVPAYETTVNFGTRAYLVQTAPSPSYIAAHRGWQSWLVLAGGVLSTGLLGALLMLGTGHTYRVRAKEQELEAIIDGTPFMLTRCSRDLRYRFISQSYANMLGRRAEDVVGKPIIEIMGDEGFATILPHVEKVLRGERAEYESEIHFQRVGKRVLRVVYIPDKTGQGSIEGWIASIVDVTEHRRAEAQRDLLIAEVNHRVKNTLATVISIAHQSFKGQQPFDVSLRSFNNRIQALAQTHSRLAEANWSGVSLKTIADDEFAPYRTDNNVHMAGPDLKLHPKYALNLGMALHELVTNAAKYGALSVKGGSVKVNWETSPLDNAVLLSWTEFGGPKVSAPQRSGFGRLLLEKVLPSNLDGTVKLDFSEGGLACLITFPLGNEVEEAAEKLGSHTDDGLSTAQGRPTRSSHLPAGTHVLLVEDESLLALELEQLFDSQVCHVIGPFADLTHAMQAAGQETIDIAILDINLNGEMVYPLAEELQRRRIPFLFLTGYDATNLPEQFRNILRISKPFDHADLMKQVQTMIVAKRSEFLAAT